MIAMSVAIQDEEFQKLMGNLEDKQKDYRPLLTKFQVIMIRSFADNFRMEGRPRRWKLLAPSTVAKRRRASKKIMQDTGRLRMSALVRRAPGNITTFSSRSLVMGSSLKQAEWLQEGTRSYTIRPKQSKVLAFRTSADNVVFTKLVRFPGLTPRPFILIQDSDISEMINVAEAYSSEE